MKGERLYEEIDCDSIRCDRAGLVDLNQARLGRRVCEEGVWLDLYFQPFGGGQTEALVLTEAAARQLRDQLTEALGPKVEAPRVWITPSTGTGTATFPKDTIIGFPVNCNCNQPWWGIVPRVCPVHGPIKPMKVTCSTGPGEDMYDTVDIR